MREAIFKTFQSRMARLGQLLKMRIFSKDIYLSRMVRLGQLERGYFQKTF